MYDLEPSPERDVLAAVNEVPRAFFRLAAMAQNIFTDLGVSPGERGVLRELFVDGQDTAPSLAQRKPVSRQAMQAILDGLVAKGLVRIDDNPRHKRSKLYRLAPQGIDLCVELQKREIAAIRELMDEAPEADFAAAAAALQTLNRLLARKLRID